MPIYKPSELLNFLDQLGIAPKKTLSQNFLIDGNVIRKIVATAHVSSEDTILEIGPGPGSLTEELLNNNATVIAIEKDRTLAQALERLKKEQHVLEIYCGDILDFPLEDALKGRKAKVIANLPYHLTTPILTRLIQLPHLFSSLFVMVQEEVARRFVAQPNTPDYSSFTLFLNFFCQCRYCFFVKKSCFYPEPKVNSAIVELKLRVPPVVSDQNAFFQTTRMAFSKRRKMLRASLKDLYGADHIETALTNCQLNPLSRPEDLSLEQWLAFFEEVAGTKKRFKAKDIFS
jgi:16S rRNA (adenine1518-N6/adenine1519-N6)-dimethyltransferase